MRTGIRLHKLRIRRLCLRACIAATVVVCAGLLLLYLALLWQFHRREAAIERLSAAGATLVLIDSHPGRCLRYVYPWLDKKAFQSVMNVDLCQVGVDKPHLAALAILKETETLRVDGEKMDWPAARDTLAQLAALGGITVNRPTPGIRALADIGIPNKGIASITLVEEPADGAEAVVSAIVDHPTVKNLQFAYWRLNGEMLRRILTVRSLLGLGILRSQLTVDPARDVIANPRLRVLRITSCQCSSDLLRYVSRFPNLEILELDGTNVNTSHIECLTSLSGLEELGLANVNLSDEHLMTLRRLRSLKRLDVSDNGVSDNGLLFLSKVLPLESIDVAFTDVTAAGVERFKALRPDCKIWWTHE